MSASRRPAPTPSSPRALRAWCRRSRIPTLKSPGRATPGFARPASRSISGFAREAARDHAGHFRRIRDKRPHVILKLAVSSDDKIGAAGRKPVAITGEAAKARVHLLRAQCDAILVGIGTVLADDPLLTCRLPGMEAHSPVRVVLDRELADSRHQPAGSFGARRRRCG